MESPPGLECYGMASIAVPIACDLAARLEGPAGHSTIFDTDKLRCGAGATP